MGRRVFKASVATSVAALLAGTAAMAADVAPLEAYGELPQLEDVRISPSGNRIGVVTEVNGERQIRVFDADMAPILALPAGPGVKVRNIQFAGDQALIVSHSDTQRAYGFTAQKYELSRGLVVPLDGKGKPQYIFANSRGLTNATFGSFGLRQVGNTWRGYYGAIELRQNASGEREFDHGRPALYEVDFAQMKERRVAASAGESGYRDWLVTRDGSVGATLDIAGNNGKWAIRNSANKIIAEGVQPKLGVDLIGFFANGSSLLYSLEDEESGESTWYEVPLAGGTSTPFYPDIEFDRTYWDPEGREFFGYESEGKAKFFNPDLQLANVQVKRGFAGKNVRLIDWSSDINRVVVNTSGNGDSGSWYMIDLAGGQAHKMGSEHPRITADMVGPVSTISYTAQDGLELNGILTLPPGIEAKNLPVVILPHGGPHSHDTEDFDWWAQAFASRGYAVFQPNFRGSTNRDAAFMRAGYGEWGRKMQTDLSDGLAVLAADGTVDPKRACIVGASYGGYAALAGVTLQQGLYRCAVSVAGVSDVKLMNRTESYERGSSNLFKQNMIEELGPSKDWDSISPSKLANRADAPILLLHGKDDTVVAYDQSKKMADALKDAGKPYKFVSLEGEDHWLSLAETRTQMLKEAVAFVQQYNPSGS